MTNGTLSISSSGAAAEGAAASGNPVIMAGRYDSSSRTLDSGDCGAIALTAAGHVITSIDSATVSGSAAENAAASGNPVLIGGRYDSSSRTLDNGDAGAIALTAAGHVMVNDGGGSLTVDGTVTANLSATDNAVLDTIETNTDSLAVTGGGTEASALRVTLANDSTGVVTVDDGGGSLTVDGTVTVAGGAAEDAAASGNPVLIGGRYDSSSRTLDNGDAGAIALTAAGHMIVAGASAENAAVSGNPLLFGGRFDSTTRVLNDGDVGAVALTKLGEVKSTVALTNPLGTNGNLKVSEQRNVFEFDATYGFSDAEMEQFTATGGSVTYTTDDGLFDLATGTSVGGYGVLRSKRAERIHPGMSLECTISAAFTSGVALSLQMAGMFTSVAAAAVGYNGSDFSILRQYGGRHHIVTLTVTTAATGAASDVSVTLNGTAFGSLSLSNAGGSKAFTAHELGSEVQTYTGWTGYHFDDKVVFFGTDVGARSGSYSFSAGTSGAAVSFATTATGAAKTNDYVAKTAWNIDRLDGSGNSTNPSGMTLDTTKLNTYRIEMDHCGTMLVSVIDPSTGQPVPCHRYQYANTAVLPFFSTPYFKVGWTSASLGSTTDLTVLGVHAEMSVEGRIQRTKRPRSTSNTVASVTTERPILSLRCNRLANGKVNHQALKIMRIAVSCDGTKTVDATGYVDQTTLGADTTGDFTNFIYVSETESVASVDTTAITSSGGTQVISMALAKSDRDSVTYYEDTPFYLNPTEILTITATSSSATEVTVSIMWQED